jgi:PleD family two-component response regulator
MGDLWRDSMHGALLQSPPDEPSGADRATALMLGLDPARAMALMRMLAPMMRVRFALDLPGALDMARELQPDLVLLGGAVEGADLSTVLAAFQSGPMLEDIPIIVVASSEDGDSEIGALRGGALAWLPHSVGSEVLLSRVRLAVRMHRSAQSRWG